MNIPFLPILIALSTTFIAISLLRPFARIINLLDEPNNRKQHAGSIPLIGGIAMYIGLFVTFLSTSTDMNQFNYLLITTLIIVIVGVFDDYKNISISLRLFFQVLVSIIVVTVGDISIGSFGNLFGTGEIILNEWSYFFSMIAIITAMNALNMADGIHGHAGGNSLITCLAILYLALDTTSQENILFLFVFCSTLIVFLINNLCIGISASKRIFMGDAGSMFIGLVIVCFLIDLSQGEERTFSPVTALWFFAVPLIEITSTTLRRLGSGKSPFKPDLYHTHHLLIRLGIREKHTLLIMLLFSLLMAVIGILGNEYEVADWVMFLGFLLVFVIYLVLSKMAISRIKNSRKESY
jgi:UDP-GlcNAc:undecaprenyl-phosphate/decaprenyl-phosphate GlcNAc-1-phosphate transferase